VVHRNQYFRYCIFEMWRLNGGNRHPSADDPRMRTLQCSRSLLIVPDQSLLASSGIIHRIFGARKCGDVRLCICSALVSLYQFVFSDLCATLNRLNRSFTVTFTTRTLYSTVSHRFLRKYTCHFGGRGLIPRGFSFWSGTRDRLAYE
jgi:hypothetical protein